MNHYILRYVLAIFGIPLVAYFILQAFNWYGNMAERYVLAPLSTERVQFPLHHPWGVGGVNRFNAEDDAGKAAIMDLLDRSISDMESWLGRVYADNYGLICLGENHDTHLRNLIAAQILPRLPADILMIEATRTQSAYFMRHLGTRSPLILLGHDMTAILQAAREANPAVRVLGIEETKRQFDNRRGGDGNSRELSIERNLKAVYKPGQRHLLLYGAFHCSHNSKLYSHLLADPPSGDTSGNKNAMMNIRITREHIEAPIEAFVYFLDEIGFTASRPEYAGDIVITDTAALVKRFREWFPFFTSNELDHFGALVIMRPLRYPTTTNPDNP